MAAKQILKKKHLEEEELAKLKKLDDNSVQEEYEYVAVPPDGGFGWIVAIAAMVFTWISILYDINDLFIFYSVM